MATVDRQAHLFRWLRGRLLAHGWEVMLRTARARLITILLCTVIIAGVVLAAAVEGFWLLKKQSLPGTGLIVGYLFDFLFLTLGLMLVFSGGLILYASLFANPEATFLLMLPARADQIFAYKFQGAIGFSSWAFVLLGLPVLGAFGLVYSVHWLYWPAVPLFLTGFVLIPGSIGALAGLLIVNLAPNRRRQVLVTVSLAIAAGIAYFGYRFVSSLSSADVSDRDAVTSLLSQLDPARQKWAASHWMTLGLQAAARGQLRDTLYPLALVWTNGLLLYLVAAFTASKIYRRGFNRLQTGGGFRKKYGGGWLDGAASWLLGFLDAQTRHLIIKDFRTFRRDPAQWAQIFIFAGLAVTYFANSREFYRSDLGLAFQHGVSLINLLATCLLLCAYMGRFIYPMLSLEGRKFWILGLMPLERRRLLVGKFAFAVVGSLAIAVPLVLTADLLLGLRAVAVVLHTVTVFAVTFGLSALAVGIGALLPNFRETDPSKIAVGFGGTMNLLAGLLFLLIVVALIAGPYHLVATFGPELSTSRWAIGLQVGGVTAGITLAVVATVMPLRAGARALQKMEF